MQINTAILFCAFPPHFFFKMNIISLLAVTFPGRLVLDQDSRALGDLSIHMSAEILPA